MCHFAFSYSPSNFRVFFQYPSFAVSFFVSTSVYLVVITFEIYWCDLFRGEATQLDREKCRMTQSSVAYTTA